MAVAKFAATSKWPGKQITREGDVFVVRGHGEISSLTITENDRLGRLVRVNDGTHAWVGSPARRAQEQARRMDAKGRDAAPEDETRPRVTEPLRLRLPLGPTCGRSGTPGLEPHGA